MEAVSRLRVTASRARLLERRPWLLPRHMLRATSALCTRGWERRSPLLCWPLGSSELVSPRFV